MNELSWLLYFADIVGNIKVLALGMLVLSCFCGFAWFISHDEHLFGKDAPSRVKPLLSLLLKVTLPLLIVAIFIPSKNTIYMIAASEMGEEAINTDAAKKVGDYLDKLLSDLTEQ